MITYQLLFHLCDKYVTGTTQEREDPLVPGFKGPFCRVTGEQSRSLDGRRGGRDRNACVMLAPASPSPGVGIAHIQNLSLYSVGPLEMPF